MKPTHTLLQRSDQKRIVKVKRVRGALEAGETPLTEAEKDIIIECARELDVGEDAKMQEALISIAMKRGNDTVLTMRAINLFIQQFRGELYQHRKTKETEAELK
jgi:hypothetical protein